MKTSDLIGPALVWAVAKIESGCAPEYFNGSVWIITGGFFHRVRRNVYAPSTDWAQGGPIIEREMIQLLPNLTKDKKFPNWDWSAASPANGQCVQIYGPTPLIAAMRCYCCAKLGEYVDIPEELCQQPNS